MLIMKPKSFVCLSIIIVVAISQQAKGSPNDQKVLSQLASKGNIRSSNNFIQLLLHAVSKERSDIQLNLEHASSQAKAKGPNPNCPDLSQTKTLYRVTRPDESCENGLLAKDPNGDATVLYHVRYGPKNVKTQFISTTTSKRIAKGKYWPKVQPGGGLVRIKTDSLPGGCKIVDLNDAVTRENELGSNPFAFNFARKDCEVLLDCGSDRVPCKLKYLKQKESKQTNSTSRTRRRTKSRRTRG